MDRLPGRGQGAAFAMLAASLRWLGWLNGIAALFLTGFSLGIVGGDAPLPDLQAPLALFLAGVVACVVGALLWGWLYGRLLREVRGGRWVVVLAVLVHGTAALLFAAGCWTCLVLASGADDALDATYSVYALRR